jgi:hypothetical protein
LVPVTV